MDILAKMHFKEYSVLSSGSDMSKKPEANINTNRENNTGIIAIGS